MFDPYHKWLGIPKDQRPPTYYQLLGLARGEDDAEVIEEAVIRQASYLRTYQIGPHAEDCTRLLNEVAEARTVLLNPAKRKEYDARLGAQVGIKPAAAPGPVRPPRPLAPLPEAAIEEVPQRSGGLLLAMGAAAAGVCLIGLLVVGAVVWLWSGSAGEPEVSPTSGPQARATPKDKRATEKPAGATKKSNVEEGTTKKNPPVKDKEKDKDKDKVIVPVPVPDHSPLDQLDPTKIAAKDIPDSLRPNLVAVVKGHTKEVFGVFFSPNGKRLASTGADGTVRIWDLTGTEPQAVTMVDPKAGWMASVAWSPDSKYVAFAAASKPQSQEIWLDIWDVAADAPALIARASFQGKAFIWCVAYAPDGKTLAVSGDGEVRLFHLTGTKLEAGAVLKGHYGEVKNLAFVRDGKLLLSASFDKTVRLWDWTAQPPTAEVLTAGNSVWHADATANGQLVVAGCYDGTVYLWDVSGAKPVERAAVKEHKQWANSVAFAPDGKTFLSTEGGGSPQQTAYVIWWDAANATVLQRWAMPERCSQGTFAPDGRYVALTCHNRSIYILKLPAR
jgi:WD40 repeat protein